jgi:hypothetical protein
VLRWVVVVVVVVAVVVVEAMLTTTFDNHIHGDGCSVFLSAAG